MAKATPPAGRRAKAAAELGQLPLQFRVTKHLEQFEERASEELAHGVTDNFLRDFWMEHLDADYWAHRRYTGGMSMRLPQGA